MNNSIPKIEAMVLREPSGTVSHISSYIRLNFGDQPPSLNILSLPQWAAQIITRLPQECRLANIISPNYNSDPHFWGFNSKPIREQN
jgi:hypothetical protein